MKFSMLWILGFAGCLLSGAAGAWLRAVWNRRRQAGDAELRQREQALQAQAWGLEASNHQLQALNQRLGQAIEEKNQFLGIVAHDLRSPLNAIVLAADILDGEEDLAEVHKTARRIHKEGMDMSAMIGRFLDIARLESGKLKADPEAMDINAQVLHIANRHQAQAQAKNIQFCFQLPDQAIEAHCDLKFTREILDNLLSNALKFSDPGTTVTLRVEPRPDAVVVSVEDQGPGLTAEDQGKLFGRFARLSAKPTAGEKSTGLGLSIVKHMVDAMEARIWVDSEPGRGAAFRVAFPCVRSEALV